MALPRLGVLIVCGAALFPTSPATQPPTSGLGRAPRAEELKAIDIDVWPDGRGLPPGGGSARQGERIYAGRCASCHGAKGEGFRPPKTVGSYWQLVGGRNSLATARPLKTVGSYWPYATTLWDYINRAMPFGRAGTLSPDEVYAVTAYVLYLNGIVGEGDVLSQTTLADVRMPNRDGFIRER
jgi:cytochrome c